MTCNMGPTNGTGQHTTAALMAEIFVLAPGRLVKLALKEIHADNGVGNLLLRRNHRQTPNYRWNIMAALYLQRALGSGSRSEFAVGLRWLGGRMEVSLAIAQCLRPVTSRLWVVSVTSQSYEES